MPAHIAVFNQRAADRLELAENTNQVIQDNAQLAATLDIVGEYRQSLGAHGLGYLADIHPAEIAI